MFLRLQKGHVPFPTPVKYHREGFLWTNLYWRFLRGQPWPQTAVSLLKIIARFEHNIEYNSNIISRIYAKCYCSLNNNLSFFKLSWQSYTCLPCLILTLNKLSKQRNSQKSCAFLKCKCFLFEQRRESKKQWVYTKQWHSLGKCSLFI